MYEPTPKQLDALANMESYGGIRSHRTAFATREEFREYWDRVSARADRVTRNRKRSRAEQGKRCRERARRRYQDDKNLEEYGRKYALRYRPSSEKLRRQLAAKAGDEARAERVATRLTDVVDDAVRADELAHRMRAQGRNRDSIRRKLRQRLFDATTIERCLENLADQGGSVLDREALARRVGTLRRKGFSRQAILRKLGGNAADHPLVEAALAAGYDDGDEAANLAAALIKLKRKDLDEKTLIRRLQSRGFRYGDIRGALER